MNKTMLYILTVVIVAVLSQITGDIAKLVLCGFFFAFAFLSSIRMIRTVTPLISIGLLAYCLAIINNLYNMELAYTPVSTALWFIGNIVMALGIIETLYKRLKYHGQSTRA